MVALTKVMVFGSRGIWPDRYTVLPHFTACEYVPMAISVGIEERRVKLAEAQGSLLNDVIRRSVGVPVRPIETGQPPAPRTSNPSTSGAPP